MGRYTHHQYISRLSREIFANAVVCPHSTSDKLKTWGKFYVMSVCCCGSKLAREYGVAFLVACDVPTSSSRTAVPLTSLSSSLSASSPSPMVKCLAPGPWSSMPSISMPSASSAPTSVVASCQTRQQGHQVAVSQPSMFHVTPSHRYSMKCFK